MLRQHFYPKNHFKPRSLSKSQKKIQISDKQIQNQENKTNQCKISFISHKLACNQVRQSRQRIIETIATENSERSHVNYITEQMKNTDSIFENCDFEAFKRDHILQPNSNKVNQYCLRKFPSSIDKKLLYLKCDNKQVRKNTFRILQKNKSFENSSFLQIKNAKKVIKTHRKLTTANEKESLRVSKGPPLLDHPAQIVLGRNIKTMARRRLQPSSDKPVTSSCSNLLSLSLSKAIKCRQARRQVEKSGLGIGRPREYRLNEAQFQHKVKGWQIEVQEELGFQ